MKPFQSVLACALMLATVVCEPSISKHPFWPSKVSSKLQSLTSRNPSTAASKQRTMVVQIRSDQPVPLVLKGRPGLTHAHTHTHAYTHVHNYPHSHSHLIHAQAHLRSLSATPKPIKLSAPPVYLRSPLAPAMLQKAAIRKPLRIKLNNVKTKSKPVFANDKPFKYERPTTVNYSQLQSLPLDAHTSFISDHFAPIYTIPAPNLALHGNQLHEEATTAYIPPIQQSTVRPQTYLPPKLSLDSSQYQVVEDETNDVTIHDPISGSQTLFAPDPDPSLPATKIRLATEPFNQPSNNSPLPADVQKDQFTAQPLVQIVGVQATAQNLPEIYPIQFTQQASLQPFITANVAALQAAPLPIYNPTYLVTQSNQLYNQHKQHLFQPNENIVEVGYVNADLTQKVASNGQILQAAKDSHHNIHPVLDAGQQYTALIAGPALSEESVFETAPFRLVNVAASTSAAPEGGFVVSNYYSNPQDSSQLFRAYAEEGTRQQKFETDQALLEIQKQKQVLEQQSQLQQHQQHLKQLTQHEQEQHLQQQQLQQAQHLQLQHQIRDSEQRHQQSLDPVAAAFKEHKRLVQQQLGDTPLRIFVPDDDSISEAQRIQKRSDVLKKGVVENVGNNTKKGTFKVEVSGGENIETRN